MSSRAVKKVRVVLGGRVRALREVERGEKSITIDSLYRVAQALKTPLGDLTSMNGHPTTRRPRRR
jgi:transcriptional regulator with XRE-family HTH domain